LFARRLDRQVALTEQVRAESIGELEARVAERTAALRAEIAERESLEAARRRGQRMEAIGQLTGGVAHEFNNLLQVMLGNLDFLLSRTEPTTRLTG
jgi:C4-dicarboxylate-specific signal transduction histidine kinase